MLHAADTDVVSVHQCEHVEFLAPGVLLALPFELQPAEGNVHLRILAKDILLPTVSLTVQTRLLHDVFRALRIVDNRIAAVLAHVKLAKVRVDGTLLAVKVQPQIVVHLVGV